MAKLTLDELEALGDEIEATQIWKGGLWQWFG